MGTSPTLDQLTGDRDNNFNLLRFCAATAVILGHSILLGGDRNSSLGWILGYAAVNCFFVISGFLVCRSLLNRRQLGNFLMARALRIYPALIAVVLLCVFGLGLWLTQAPTDVFLSHPQTQRFLWQNMLLLVGESEVYLPGLFSASPFPGQVNAPLWTLQYEAGMYLAMAALFFLARRISREDGDIVFRVAVLAIAVLSMVVYLGNVAGSRPQTGMAANIVRFSAMFGAGAACYLLRQHIRLQWPVALLLLATTLACSGIRPLFVTLSWLSLPYLLLFLAYVPAGAIRRFNGFGDYSYGLYILAFPIQQLLILHWPHMDATTLFVTAMVCTLPLAVCSWHWLEKPALSYKRRIPADHSSAAMIR